MKDIKELALKVGNELSKEDKFHWDGSLFVFIEKFFAAYTEGQEPVAWTTMPDADDWDFVSGSKNPNNHLEGVWHPLFAAPPLTEPAPAVDPQRIAKWRDAALSRRVPLERRVGRQRIGETECVTLNAHTVARTWK